jgi:hypothetical protein
MSLSGNRTISLGLSADLTIPAFARRHEARRNQPYRITAEGIEISPLVTVFLVSPILNPQSRIRARPRGDTDA